MASPQKPPTLYFLQASRFIRIAWLLTELSIPYESIFFPRVNNKAPDEFKGRGGNPLGKARTLVDGDLTLGESGAITEYMKSFFWSIFTLLMYSFVDAFYPFSSLLPTPFSPSIHVP